MKNPVILRDWKTIFSSFLFSFFLLQCYLIKEEHSQWQSHSHVSLNPRYGFEYTGWWMTRVSMSLCALCLCMGLTWSSKGRSQKAGMYLAHSTKTNSCCFIDSHTSVMVAIFLVRMSPLSIGAGDVIYTGKCIYEVIWGLVTVTVDMSPKHDVRPPYLSWQYVCLDECVDGW